MRGRRTTRPKEPVRCYGTNRSLPISGPKTEPRDSFRLTDLRASLLYQRRAARDTGKSGNVLPLTKPCSLSIIHGFECPYNDGLRGGAGRSGPRPGCRRRLAGLAGITLAARPSDLYRDAGTPGGDYSDLSYCGDTGSAGDFTIAR